MLNRDPIEIQRTHGVFGKAGPESVSTPVWQRSVLILSLLVFGNAVSAWPAACQAVSQPKKVLVFHSFTHRDSFFALEPLEATIRAHSSVPVNFYVEYLEATRFSDDDYRKNLSETIRSAYSKPKPDLVVVSALPALRFALDYRSRMFPGVPIVFVEIDAGRIQAPITWRGVTGVTISADISGSVNLALRLHPDTYNVVLLSGDSDFESYWDDRFRSQLQSDHPNLRLINIIGLPPRDALQQISALPPHTVVFALILSEEYVDSDLKVFDLTKAVGQIFPTYSIFNYCFGHGCVGGSYEDEAADGKEAGELAARVLAGEKPENIPIELGSSSRVTVDWRELRHWNIPESALPPGSVVLYREPTIWERGRKYLPLAIALVVLQLLLIAGFLWQRARRRNAQTMLRESETRFRVMADAAPSLIWMCDRAGELIYQNEQLIAFIGSESSTPNAATWAECVHPDDVKQLEGQMQTGLKTRERFSMEYRLRRQDGSYRWMFDVVAPRVDGAGSFAGFIGSAVDVNDRKLAQEALEKVSGQLIAAQEKERSYLARELHDDICQRLAMLSLRIEKVRKNSDSSKKPVSEQLEEIWQQCSTLTGDVQNLSHELHPSILDNLGLVAAVKSFCREISEQNGVVVEFTHGNIPSALPREVSLSLFRVIQEALHNAVKYSGQEQFAVYLQGNADAVELEVRDHGVGFDATAKNHKGLGLVSMTERIHLLNGKITIDSIPGAGTTVRARVPLVAVPTAQAVTAN
jgi:PAS domain S-box-containing protein